MLGKVVIAASLTLYNIIIPSTTGKSNLFFIPLCLCSGLRLGIFYGVFKMKPIFLTKGLVAVVDDSDYDELSKYLWHAQYSSGSDCYYAARKEWCKKSKKQKIIYMHRQIMNPSDNMTVDHIEHNTLDNRKKSLRVVTLSENCHNKRVRRDSKSGVTGVCFNKTTKRWHSYIKIKGKLINLGTFKLKCMAVKKRLEAEAALINKPAS